MCRSSHGIAMTGRTRGFLEGAPDLAVEVRSPGDRSAAIADKVAQYLATGTLLVWVVDPQARRVVAHRPGAPAIALDASARIDGAGVLPEFACNVSAFFPEE